MTPEDILRMAREQGLPETATEGVFIVNSDDLGRFAALVAAIEREACAKIAWNHEPDENGPIETAIRARGKSHD